MCKVRIGKMTIVANIQKNLIPQKQLDYFVLNYKVGWTVEGYTLCSQTQFNIMTNEPRRATLGPPWWMWARKGKLER